MISPSKLALTALCIPDADVVVERNDGLAMYPDVLADRSNLLDARRGFFARKVADVLAEKSTGEHDGIVEDVARALDLAIRLYLAEREDTRANEIETSAVSVVVAASDSLVGVYVEPYLARRGSPAALVVAPLYEAGRRDETTLALVEEIVSAGGCAAEVLYAVRERFGMKIHGDEDERIAYALNRANCHAGCNLAHRAGAKAYRAGVERHARPLLDGRFSEAWILGWDRAAYDDAPGI